MTKYDWAGYITTVIILIAIIAMVGGCKYVDPAQNPGS